MKILLSKNKCDKCIDLLLLNIHYIYRNGHQKVERLIILSGDDPKQTRELQSVVAGLFITNNIIMTRAVL